MLKPGLHPSLNFSESRRPCLQGFFPDSPMQDIRYRMAQLAIRISNMSTALAVLSMGDNESKFVLEASF